MLTNQYHLLTAEEKEDLAKCIKRGEIIPCTEEEKNEFFILLNSGRYVEGSFPFGQEFHTSYLEVFEPLERLYDENDEDYPW